MSVNEWEWHSLGSYVQKMHRFMCWWKRSGLASQAQNLDPGFCSKRYSLAHCFIIIFSVGCQDVGYWLPPLSSCSSGNLLFVYGRSDGEVLLSHGCVVWSVTGCATLRDFLYESALSRECWRVSNLVVFWIQSRIAFEYVGSNTKKYSDASWYSSKEPRSWTGTQDSKKKKKN